MLSNLRYVSFFERPHGKLVPMTIENTMVDETNRTHRAEPPERVCCIGCRRSLPWTAAVLCRFEDRIHDLVKCVWPICGGSESGRGLPQSKTLSRRPGMSDNPRAHRSADSLVRVTFGQTNRLRKVGLGTCHFEQVLHLVAACCGLLQLRRKN